MKIFASTSRAHRRTALSIREMVPGTDSAILLDVSFRLMALTFSPLYSEIGTARYGAFLRPEVSGNEDRKAPSNRRALRNRRRGCLKRNQRCGAFGVLFDAHRSLQTCWRLETASQTGVDAGSLPRRYQRIAKQLFWRDSPKTQAPWCGRQEIDAGVGSTIA